MCANYNKESILKQIDFLNLTIQKDRESSVSAINRMIDDYGEAVFNIIYDYPVVLNLLEPSSIEQAIIHKRVSLISFFPMLVNNYKRVDEVWETIVENIETYEVGAYLWKIGSKNLNKCIKLYFDKVYPTDPEKIFFKLEDDGLFFRSEEICNMFIEYWNKCGKPEMNEYAFENLLSGAQIQEQEYALICAIKLCPESLKHKVKDLKWMYGNIGISTIKVEMAIEERLKN